MLGCCDDNCYHLYNPENKRIVTKDVVFLENISGINRTTTNSTRIKQCKDR